MKGTRLRGGDLDECLGEDVLAGVLRHVVEAAAPVEGAADGGARLELPLDPVPETPFFLAHVRHRNVAETAPVRRLPSPAGIEAGPVQPNQICPSPVANPLHGPF